MTSLARRLAEFWRARCAALYALWSASFAPRAQNFVAKFKPNRSMLRELTWFSLVLGAVGLVLIFFVGSAARHRTAENLADFQILDFLRIDIAKRLAECRVPGGEDRECVELITLNESRAFWRVLDYKGDVRYSLSFAQAGFGQSFSSCKKTEVREVAGAKIFLCALSDNVYRIVQRADGSAGAVQLDQWLERRDLTMTNLAAARSMRFAVAGMAFTLIALLSALLFVLRRRFRRLFNGLAGELDAFRRGRQDRILDAYPREIHGLVASFNGALEKNASLVNRQKRNVNKMAHDLRHQLVNIDLAARGDSETGVTQELETLNQLVERYLVLVDWVGPSEGGKAQQVSEVLEGVRRAFSRRLRVDPLEIEVDCPPDLIARAHPTDLKIILNNLMTNAHRFAASKIVMSAAPSGVGGVQLAVDDDGPGVPEADRDKVLRWGATLDHGAPGSGFGLAIVAEQVGELYAGSMRLETSRLGGLRVVVVLPPPQDAEFFAPWERRGGSA